MRPLPSIRILSLLAACSLAAPAFAANGLFYDPSNAASPTGRTLGYELFRTIGCPGRGLLETPCEVPPENQPPAAAPPAYVAPAAAASAFSSPAPSSSASATAIPQLEGARFDFDRSDIRHEDRAALDRDAEALAQSPRISVEIAGHTDSIGSEAYNLRLGSRRALAVKRYLVGKGVSADRMMTKSYGEGQPIADNKTPDGRAMNRRAEIIPLP